MKHLGGGWLPRVTLHLFVVPHFNFVDTANRAVARFSVTGGQYRECRRHEPCREFWGYLTPENFQIWGFRNAIFSTCHEMSPKKRPRLMKIANTASSYN